MAAAFVPAPSLAIAGRPRAAAVSSRRGRPAWPPRPPPPAFLHTLRASAVPPSPPSPGPDVPGSSSSPSATPTGSAGAAAGAADATGSDAAAEVSTTSTPSAATGAGAAAPTAEPSLPSSALPSPNPPPPAAPRRELKGEDYSAMESAAALLLLSRAVKAVRDGGARPSGADVEAALLAIEANQRRARSVTDVRELAGEWELVFTAGAARRGRRWNPAAWPIYFPVRARQTFTLLRADAGTFDNAVYAAGTVFRFTGPFRWVGGRRNRAEFTFTTAALRVGPLPAVTFPAGGPATLDGLTAKTLPFFTFFFCRRGILAARGRGGGVALYRRIRKQDLSLKEL